jgi:hypothetical protein
MYVVKMTEEAHVWASAGSQMINQVYIDDTAWDVFTKGQFLSFKPLFGGCLFLFDTEALICHWWCMASKQLKKQMYGYQQCLKRSIRCILTI